eukprot:3195677-Amphidinium_carterae.1
MEFVIGQIALLSDAPPCSSDGLVPICWGHTPSVRSVDIGPSLNLGFDGLGSRVAVPQNG